MSENILVDLALALDKGEIDSSDLEWICANQEKRDHITNVYTAEVSPKTVAKVLINDWAPIQDRYGLEYDDVPAWRVRECINFYVDGTVAKYGLIKLFEYFAEHAAKVKAYSVFELSDMIIEQKGWTWDQVGIDPELIKSCEK